jgi:hypothetical protein
MADVDQFLISLGLQDFLPHFQKEQIDMEALRLLSKSDLIVRLISLGLPLDARRKILSALASCGDIDEREREIVAGYEVDDFMSNIDIHTCRPVNVEEATVSKTHEAAWKVGDEVEAFDEVDGHWYLGSVKEVSECGRLCLIQWAGEYEAYLDELKTVDQMRCPVDSKEMDMDGLQGEDGVHGINLYPMEACKSDSSDDEIVYF